MAPNQGIFAPLSLQFTQSQVTESSSTVRLSLYEVLQKFGSYLAFVIRFTALMIGSFQKHSIDNSMIKKLYSANPDKTNEDKLMDTIGLFEDQKSVRLKKAITDRHIFSYKFSRWWVVRHFSSPFCCCCRAKRSRDDFLQKDA